VIAAVERGYADPRGGELAWTYHALVDGLRPGATYGYAVTADNDRNAVDPFSATFRTAPEGRAAFRFTSFGDLAAPSAPWASSASQCAYAVGAVEAFQPLFHLLNGDQAAAGPGPAAAPHASREFANNLQASAAYRPWLPVPADHGTEPADRERALGHYLARYSLPGNGVAGFEGRWYGFRVGTAAFLCLSGDDARSGYSGGAQTRWLEAALAAARGDASIDWVVVQLHQCACASSPAVEDGDDAGPGIRQQWLPLFDRYEVDLVVCGHSAGYERSFPVRGFDSAGPLRPHPVTTVDSGVFDTSQGTVHLVLGGAGGAVSGGAKSGGAESGGAESGAGTGGVGGTDGVGGAGGTSDADGPGGAGNVAWSARRDVTGGYGLAVFDVNPGAEAGAQTSITVRYYHAVGADPGADLGDGGTSDDYALFDTFTLVRPRSDGRRWHPREPVAFNLA
jgi:hypothetical protein